jgi:hypothetical protein
LCLSLTLNRKFGTTASLSNSSRLNKGIDNQYTAMVDSKSYSTPPSYMGDFNEWFRGFSDAESTFGFILTAGGRNASFSFRISLHLDDKNLLYFIKKKD